MNVLSDTEAESVLALQPGEGGEDLERILKNVSDWLARETGRTDWGGSSSRTEYHDGGDGWVSPEYFPLTSVSLVNVDPAHDWDSSDDYDADDYYVGTDRVWAESGCFADGVDAVKITYTGGYASTDDIPTTIKSAGEKLLMMKWNTRHRSNFDVDTSAIEENTLREIRTMIANFVRKSDFA